MHWRLLFVFHYLSFWGSHIGEMKRPLILSEVKNKTKRKKKINHPAALNPGNSSATVLDPRKTWGIPTIQGNPPLHSSFLVPLVMPGSSRVAKSSAAFRQNAESREAEVFSPAKLLAAQRICVEISHSQEVLNQGTSSPALPQRSRLL